MAWPIKPGNPASSESTKSGSFAGAGIGDEHEVAGSGEFADSPARIGKEVNHDGMSSIEEERSCAEIHAVTQDGCEGARRDRL